MEGNLKKIFIVLLFCLFSIFGWGFPYWVSSTGEATWVNAESETPLSGTACCSVSIMNSNIAAGDTAYLRAGTYSYTTEYGSHLYLNGVNGSASQWITISAYNSETVNFTGTYGTRMWGLTIQNSSYVILDRIVFADYSDYKINHDSNHLEIKNCTFKNNTSPYQDGIFGMFEDAFGGTEYNHPVSHIWIHDCTFYKLSAGGSNCTDEGGDALRIGYHSLTCHNSNCAEGLNANITVEDCYIAYGGHVTFENYGQKCVIKNNRSHNEPWYPEYDIGCRETVTYPSDEYTNESYTGLYSHRNWQITDTFSSDKRYNLYEKNRIGHPGVNPNNNGSTNLVLAAPGNIVRLNYLFNAMHNNMKTKYGEDYGWQADGGCRNRVYQNTLYRSGYGYQPFMDDYPWPLPLEGFRYYAPADNPGNVFKNNIVYESYAGVHGTDDIDSNTSSPPSVEVNNWGTNNGNGCTGWGNPYFVNKDLSDPMSATLPDLRLQSGSPALNGGMYLTQAYGSDTDSITLVVDDALYFQDGTWGADMTHGVSLFSDHIAIGTVSNTVEIDSINYSTNTITLASAKTWSDDAPIWLYKDSGGNVVLNGAAPNYGAYQGFGESIMATDIKLVMLSSMWFTNALKLWCLAVLYSLLGYGIRKLYTRF